MKKLIIFALMAFAGWNYYQKSIATPTPAVVAAASTRSQPAQSFTCDGRQHCSQMRSRAEAEYFVRHCPNTKMDGDNDGIPCENDSRF
ncbi:MAG: excalibur calcium-binding domain-containing protein [Pseudomonas sp.]|nr:excalibur calcium-binding domain-containing protein [Pseudomonas sp.]